MKRADEIIKSIEKLEAELTEANKHLDELSYAEFDRVYQRLRLLQITDFFGMD